MWRRTGALSAATREDLGKRLLGSVPRSRIAHGSLLQAGEVSPLCSAPMAFTTGSSLPCGPLSRAGTVCPRELPGTCLAYLGPFYTPLDLLAWVWSPPFYRGGSRGPEKQGAGEATQLARGMAAGTSELGICPHLPLSRP